MLAVLIHGTDQTALRFAFQAKLIPFAINIQLKFAAAKRDLFLLFLIIQGGKGDVGRGAAVIADAGLRIENRLAFSHVKQRFGGFVIHKRRTDRGHRRDQVEFFQLRKRERAMAYCFVEHDALTLLKQRVFHTSNGFHHQLKMARKNAALVILIT